MNCHRFARMGALWIVLLSVLWMGGLLSARAADQKPNLKKYSAALSYVKKEQPEELNLGSVTFSPAQLLSILNAMPDGGSLHFSTVWNNCAFTDASKSIDLRKISKTPARADLEAIAALCRQCKTINLCGDHAPSAQVTTALAAQYPDIRFAWNVRLGRTRYQLSSLASAYSTYRKNYPDTVTEKDMEALKYCPDMKALDVGHNEIKKLNFLHHVPDLEMLILADNPIKDITPLGGLEHLQYLELFSTQVTDLTPLANCKELLDLNIAYTSITSLKPLDDLPNLERLWAIHCNKLPKAEINRFKATHPNCQVNFGGSAWQWRDHPRYTHYRWCLKHGRWIPFDQPLPSN
ncbi:MAG: leucine-rich repeat domain-containing protein [Clostridia bacterium]|nr:leucine-rich repeat domain-containing protein [Clostridia bacterium]